MRENFLDEIKNDEKNMNDQIFQEYFGYHSPSILVKDLLYKNDTIVKYINESLIDLRNSIDGEKIPENENPKKVVDIVEKILDFNKQQKGKGIKILTPKQMLQRLPKALAQVKPGNTSEKLLNEIR